MRLLGFIPIALPILSLEWLRSLTVPLDQYHMVSGSRSKPGRQDPGGAGYGPVSPAGAVSG